MIGPKVYHLDAEATARAFRRMRDGPAELVHEAVDIRVMRWWERALLWLDQVWE